ncbi:MAG: nucleotidyltransferase domain-containing protein [Candidatus Latescibacterota bacterium]
MKPDAIAREYSRKVRAALGSRVRDIILFGSRARGDNTEWSDYDVLLIVDKRDRSLRDILIDIEVGILDTYERLVGSIVYEAGEWEKKKQSPLGMNIGKDGIRL